MADTGKFGLAFGNKAPNAVGSLAELANNDLQKYWDRTQKTSPNSVVIKGSQANLSNPNTTVEDRLPSWVNVNKGQESGSSNDSSETSTDSITDTYNPTAYYPSYGGGSYSGSGSSTSDEPTEKQKKAAENQKKLAAFEAQNTRDQLAERFNYFDQSNKNLRQFADAQRVQNERKASSERFNAQRDMLDSLFALRNHMGQALNGSAAYGLMDMARNRNDYTNTKHWDTLIDNQNAVENSYLQAYNQNQLAKIDAQLNARKDLADREANLAANLNNIDESFFELPGEGSSINLLGRDSSGVPESSLSEEYARQSGYQTSGYGIPDRQVTGADPLNLNVMMNQASWEPYVMSDKERARIQPGRLNESSYFNRLINNYNGYRS